MGLLNEYLTALLLSLLKAAFTNLSYPEGMRTPSVFHSMPLAGFPALPFVSVTLEQMMQTEVPIGRDTAEFIGEANLVTTFVRRMWRVSVLSSNATEREFLRDAVISIFQSIMNSVFLPLAQNQMHSFMSESGQVVNTREEGLVPGFYYSEILLDVEGPLNVSITPDFGIINSIDISQFDPNNNLISSVILPTI